MCRGILFFLILSFSANCFAQNIIKSDSPHPKLLSVEKYNGAYSDDDTDIEYMYLRQMENQGIEPGYYELAEAWKKHVKRKV